MSYLSLQRSDKRLVPPHHPQGAQLNARQARPALQAYRVIVNRLLAQPCRFHALGVSSAAVSADAEKLFDLCCVTVHPVSRP